MGFVIFLSFFVLVGLLALYDGADSRDPEERGWFAAPRGDRSAVAYRTSTRRS
jgi:hypothetical protein